MGDGFVQEIYVPGDIEVNNLTGLFHEESGTLLMNPEGIDPEKLVKMPETPEMFRDLNEVLILKPDQDIREIKDGGEQLNAEIRQRAKEK